MKELRMHIHRNENYGGTSFCNKVNDIFTWHLLTLKVAALGEKKYFIIHGE